MTRYYLFLLHILENMHCLLSFCMCTVCMILMISTESTFAFGTSVTRCDTITGDDRDEYMIDKLRPCETLSYRLIEAMPIGTRLHITLSYEDFLRGEVLYCVGMLLSFVTLCGWYKFRMNVPKDKCVDLSIKKWVLVFSLAAISAVVVIVPVGMFSGQKSTFSSLFDGIVFAGFGGALMSLIAASILLHLLCYPVPDCDICLCTSL